MRGEQEIRAELTSAWAALEAARDTVTRLKDELRRASGSWLAEVPSAGEMRTEADFAVRQVLDADLPAGLPAARERLLAGEVRLTDSMVYPELVEQNLGETVGYARLFSSESAAREWAVARAQEEWAKR